MLITITMPEVTPEGELADEIMFRKKELQTRTNSYDNIYTEK